MTTRQLLYGNLGFVMTVGGLEANLAKSIY